MAPVAKKKAVVPTQVEKKKNEKAVSGQLQKKLDKKQKKKFKPKRDRGVVLLRHLPKAFLEEQIKEYFAQFGDVTRVRLARSRRTGGSKSFAFVEFRVPEVAKIAAETMDNYLMFQKLVKAHYIPPEKQNYDYFRTRVRSVVNDHGKTIFTSNKIIAKAKKVKAHNRWTEETYSNRVSKALKKLEKIKKKYADLGLNFESIVVKPKLAVPANTDLEDTQEINTTNASVESQEDKPGKLLLIKKRKLSKEQKQEEQKKKKEKPSLTQLLEKTINDSESSADEDYLPIEDYNPNETLEIPPDAGTKKTLSNTLIKTITEAESDSDESFDPSDEETDEEDSEDVTLETDSADDETEDETEDEISEEEESVDGEQIFKTNKKSKYEKGDRLEQIIRRKPHSGGITKKVLKPKTHKAANNKIKSSVNLGKMKAMAANEIVKENNLKSVKKSDLKIKKKVK